MKRGFDDQNNYQRNRKRLILRLSDPYKIVLLAPFIFVLHVAEEFPNFVEWANSLITRDITQEMFLMVNATGLVIIVLLVVLMSTTKDTGAIVLVLAWLSFAMFANSLVHLIATIVHGYSPGAITSAVLYLPYFVWFVWCLLKTKKLSPVVIALTILIGSLPMFLHGYMIVFEGRRLF